MVTQEQAIELAKRELGEHGHTASDYHLTVDQENPGEEHWMVWCDKKGPFPIPGGRHAVRVNKNTGDAQFMPGE